MNEQAIKEVFGRLKETTKQYYRWQMVKAKTKFAHDAAYETGIVSGEIVGKNEVERMGSMRLTQPVLVDEYYGARLAEMEAEMEYRLALLEKEELLTIMEANRVSQN